MTIETSVFFVIYGPVLKNDYEWGNDSEIITVEFLTETDIRTFEGMAPTGTKVYWRGREYRCESVVAGLGRAVVSFSIHDGDQSIELGTTILRRNCEHVDQQKLYQIRKQYLPLPLHSLIQAIS